MNLYTKILLVTLVILGGLIAFRYYRNENRVKLPAGVHQVRVKEVIQTSNYTYLRVSEKRHDYWCAVVKDSIGKGQTCYWTRGMEMKNFHSQELKRDFASIYFISDLSSSPEFAGNLTHGESMGMPTTTKGRPMIAIKHGIMVEKAPGGITIGELFAHRAQYAGKPVKIRGEVIKVTTGVMDRNWVHLQDGTQDKGNYDFVLTTKDTVSVGNTIVAEGVISLDKNYGYGYYYPVIMEDAVIK